MIGVIVESPAKAKTIEKILNNGGEKKYIVKSSFGHIRDLPKKELGIDTQNGFKPDYKILKIRTAQVKELLELKKKCSDIILAGDEDREGEAICWHVATVLKLNPLEAKRIVFHEITKSALDKAISSPRNIDMSLVLAQQARRLLDRLLGFEISPILWKHIMPDISAGRVQSIVVKLLKDKENVINEFKDGRYYASRGLFETENGIKMSGLCEKKWDKEVDAMEFLDSCKTASFKIISVDKKERTREPQPPFTTSTLQQDASRRYNISSQIVMNIAQKLYEMGFITYHRTDSVNLSDDALNSIETYVKGKYGENYYKRRLYTTKSKGAQEAHEAIRPTDVNRKELINADGEKVEGLEEKIYELIWKRTVASQMETAKYQVVEVKVEKYNDKVIYLCKGEWCIFKGFTMVYEESVDDDKKKIQDEEEGTDEEKEINKKYVKEWLKIKVPMEVGMKNIIMSEKFKEPPAHYSEATLIKKLEQSGIGRPSTYASMINTVLNRKYVEKGNKPGKKVKYSVWTLVKGKDDIKKEEKDKMLGAEKGKLFITDLGMNVVNFLEKNFSDVMEYDFTAEIEKNLDKVAEGKFIWNDVVNDFYNKFHPTVLKLKGVKVEGNDDIGGGSKPFEKERHLIGKSEKLGGEVFGMIGKYGAYYEVINDKGEMIKRASLPKGKMIAEMTMEDVEGGALFPKVLGEIEGKEVKLNNGRYGLYFQYDGANYSYRGGKGVEEIVLEDFGKFLKAKKDEVEGSSEESSVKPKSKLLREVTKTTKIMEGEYGKFIMIGKKFAPFPEGENIEKVTGKRCNEILEEYLLKKKSGVKKYNKKN